MPDYSHKQRWGVYNVISVKDAYRIVKSLSSNREFNTKTAQEFFMEQGVTCWGLVAPVDLLADTVNREEVPRTAAEMAKEDHDSDMS